MNTKQKVVSTAILLVADFLWLGLFMGGRYNKMINDIQGENMKTNPIFAILSYMLMVIGLNIFVLPNIRKGYELEDSFRYGMTFGVILYGVYDFTAGAVFRKWDKGLAVIDVLWGGFVYFIACYIGSSAI